MSAFEVATVILPMFSVLQDQLRYTVFEAVTFSGVRRSFSSLWGQYGFLRAVLLLFIFPNAPEVISQIRDTLATSVDEDLMMIKKSLADDCNMMAVACAIVAQIAISALALDHLESTHWTAKGAFVVSLVTAGLSVFYGCLLQQKISSLLKARDLKNWLSRPGGQKERREVDVLIEKYLQVKRKHWNAGVEASSGEIGKPLEDARASITDFKDANSWKAVSFNAVIMTKVPTLLLKYSVGSFLVGSRVRCQ
ncbi:hypothetical protein B0J12DRAFT_131104 [Macrophomina phaseolina]|uniref:Uncharacterized protein n=1 Tax=Macrophomina phaseolina TaxID=35725 RepID=A0ABQ8G6J5_9PEZI|nr:hypothetical protein B0J12DRAFT_131104 [Macrophomina phaseolina]